MLARRAAAVARQRRAASGEGSGRGGRAAGVRQARSVAPQVVSGRVRGEGRGGDALREKRSALSPGQPTCSAAIRWRP